MAGRGDVEPSGFGVMLRRIRETGGLTQAALAAIAGLHPNTIAKLERGDQEPNWPVVLKLAKALGVECTVFSSPTVTGASAPDAVPASLASNDGKKGARPGGGS